MASNPTFRVDWDGGEGRFDMGTRLSEESALFRVDVLGDLVAQAEDAYEKAFEELNPGLAERGQRIKNRSRRLTAETMVGLTITGANPLNNGDVAMSLSDGRVLVFAAQKEDVGIFSVDSIADAEEEGKRRFRGDRYTQEPLQSDEAHAASDASLELTNRMLGIAA
jgi:hypothetical protein